MSSALFIYHLIEGVGLASNWQRRLELDLSLTIVSAGKAVRIVGGTEKIGLVQ